MGSGLTLGNELRRQVLTSKRLYGEGAPAESRRVREARRTALPRGSQSWLLREWD